MTDKPFLFKGIYYRDGHDVHCFLSNHIDLQQYTVICDLAKPGISYVRGYYDRATHSFKASTRRLSRSELQDLALNRLKINTLDSNLMKAKGYTE